MAANLTLTSPSVASDGKTFTATASGGTGTGYALSSGSVITGLTVKATIGGLVYSYVVASSSFAGDTLTFVTSAPVPSSATVTALTLDVATGSNLTDSGANTAQGQTAVAVTNNSTVTLSNFALTNSNVLTVGDLGTITLVGRTFYASSPYDIRTTITGTDAFAVVYGISETFTVSVDGGAFTNVTVTGTSLAMVLPLFTGLSDTAHTVRILAGGNHYTSRDLFFMVKGTGTLTAPAVSGTVYPPRSASVSGHVNLTGDFGNSTQAPGASYAGNQLASVRFRSNAPSLYAYCFQQSNVKWRLIVDGVDSGSTASASGTNNTWDFTQVGSGLDTGSYHDYELVAVGTNIHYLYGILAGGSGLLDLTATITARTVKSVYYGDSKFASSGIFTDVSQNSPYKIARQRSSIASAIVSAVGGTSVEGTGSAGQARTANITGISGLTEVHIDYGTNDADADVTDGSFKTAFKAMLTAIRTGLPTPRIYVYQLLPETNFAAKNTAIQAAISEVADGNTVYVKAAADIVLASDTVDNRHPNATGTSKVANNVIPYVESTGFTTSGTSGTVTVTMAASTTFNGVDTVTLSASAGTLDVTVTGSASGDGTGTVIVTPDAGETSFTYTASGTATISYTNGQGWTNPAATSYVASVVAAQRVIFGGSSRIYP